MPDFEWDAAKDRANRTKHGIGFELAQHAFLDPLRVIAEDLDHGGEEQRDFCFGRVEGGALYLAKPEDQDFRGRLLAERKGDL
jgi:uncharacterized DUF497 family protein